MKMNPIDAYSEAGEKAAKARNVGDEMAARFHSDWAKRAMRFETPEYRAQCDQAFNKAYLLARKSKY